MPETGNAELETTSNVQTVNEDSKKLTLSDFSKFRSFI